MFSARTTETKCHHPQNSLPPPEHRESHFPCFWSSVINLPSRVKPRVLVQHGLVTGDLSRERWWWYLPVVVVHDFQCLMELSACNHFLTWGMCIPPDTVLSRLFLSSPNLSARCGRLCVYWQCGRNSGFAYPVPSCALPFPSTEPTELKSAYLIGNM